VAVSDSDIAAALELFEGLGPLTTRKMMGGLCLYRDGTIFALLDASGGLFLKAKDDLVPRLENMGAEQWTYTRKDGKTTAMPYWSLPDAALDDPDLACELARDALDRLEG